MEVITYLVVISKINLLLYEGQSSFVNCRQVFSHILGSHKNPLEARSQPPPFIAIPEHMDKKNSVYILYTVAALSLQLNYF